MTYIGFLSVFFCVWHRRVDVLQIAEVQILSTRLTPRAWRGTNDSEVHTAIQWCCIGLYTIISCQHFIKMFFVWFALHRLYTQSMPDLSNHWWVVRTYYMLRANTKYTSYTPRITVCMGLANYANYFFSSLRFMLALNGEVSPQRQGTHHH